MKNAIKKMKFVIAGLGLLIGLGVALSLQADIKFFWLDHPTGRTNPHDPLSPLYISPTVPATVVVGTFTNSPTISPTLTLTTVPPTLTLTPTMTFTPLPGSPTVSPTTTPSPSASPTPQTGGWPDVYGPSTSGSVMLGGNGYAAGGTDGLTEITGADGAGGSSFYTDVTLSSSAYSSGVVFSNGFWGANEPITQNAGTYSSLSITVAIPTLGGANNPSLIVPGISLVYQPSGQSFTSQTVVLSMENFIVGGPQFMQPSTSNSTPLWYTAVIPLSVFETLCNSTTGVTATAADLQDLVGVEVQPANYGNSGIITSEIYVGSLIFGSASNSTCPTGTSGNDFSGLFSDFESGTQNSWGGYWSANADSFSATDCPGYVAAPGSPNLTELVYGGVTDTAGAAGSDTPSHDGHLDGWVGAENGPYGSPACTNSIAFPFLNSTSNLLPVDPALSGNSAADQAYDVDLSNNSFITTLPATGATGLSFRLKLGPNGDSGQVYKVVIDRDNPSGVAWGDALAGATAGGATGDNAGYLYYVQIAASSLSASQWTYFAVPFPPDGFCSECNGLNQVVPTGPVTTAQATANYNNAAGNYTAHADQSSNTELFWGQDMYNTTCPSTVTPTGPSGSNGNAPTIATSPNPGSWQRTDIYDVGYAPLLRGMRGDIYIDDVQFYAGSGPVAAVRKTPKR